MNRRLIRKLRIEVILCVLSFLSGCWFTYNFLQLPILNCDDKQAVKILHHPVSYYLIIIVITSPQNVHARKVIRNTWFKLCENDVSVKHYLVIGTANLSADLVHSLHKEQEEYDDIIFLDNVVDNYENLTLKMMETYLWLFNKNLDYNYVLKCDDDSFVNTPDLLLDLKKNYGNNISHRLYWGFFNGRASVKRSGKWKEGDWILCDYYLPYALGGGFVLSKSLVDYIATNAKYLKLYRSEDVSVGAWLAGVADIERRHDPHFNTEFTSRGCSNNYLISHKASLFDLKMFYKALTETNKLCFSEVKLRNSYVYNWTVPPSKCCMRNDPTIP